MSDANKTCETCRWWGETRYLPNGSAKCLNPRVGAGGDDFSDGAHDCEQWGGIYTGPDFSCVHWTEKAAEKR